MFQRAALIVLFASLLAPVVNADDRAPFTSDDFVTSYWAGPPGEFTTFDRYQEIKNANFSVAFPVIYGSTLERNKAMLDYCQKLGMKAIIYDNRMVAEIAGSADRKKALDEMVRDYKDHPALLAYYVTDDPAAGAFDGLAEVVAYLKERDPKHPAYINLLPTWARQIPHPGGNKKLSYLGTETYEEYVRTFVKKVKPAWLCYDNYGMLKGGDRGDFHENLATVRKVALESDLPFWNIVLLTQHGDFRVLTEPELRFEAMQTLAFGARGVVWFTYWSPQGIDTGTTWTHAMIDEHGKRDPHYDMVRAINADALAMGRELKNATSESAYHTGAESTIAATERPLISFTGGAKLSVGMFAAKGKKHMAVIANRDYKNAARDTVKLADPAAQVERFDPATAKWSRAADAGNLPIELPAGGAVLIRW
jgi:hypothetical protein